MVEREVEWDESTRGRALRLTEWEDGRCSCGCGQPIADAHDPKKPWIVDHFVCYAGRAKEQVVRQHRADAENANKPEGWDDGRHYFLREPTQDELAKKPPPGGREGAHGGQ